jgi:hypothetical protein
MLVAKALLLRTESEDSREAPPLTRVGGVGVTVPLLLRREGDEEVAAAAALAAATFAL